MCRSKTFSTICSIDPAQQARTRIEAGMNPTTAGAMFLAFLAALPKGTATDIHILTDADADGLPAGALLLRALQAAGNPSVTVETRGKFENAWMPSVHERLRLR